MEHGRQPHQPLDDNTSPPARERAAPATAQRPPRPRLYMIDALRLLAALMVALHHYIGTYRANQPDNHIWDRPVSEIFPTLFPFATYGWIGVEFFFVISGFVICMSSWGRRVRDFFVSRVIRLYPAYWFAVLFTTAVLTLWPAEFTAIPSVKVILNLSMLQQGEGAPAVEGVYWTLWSELRFYVIFMLVVATGLTYRKVVMFCCVWGTLAAVAPNSGIPLLVTAVNPEAAWFFIAGLALYLMHRFGQDQLLWGILGLNWVMSQNQLLARISVEKVSSWSVSLILYTLFLLLMLGIALGLTDRIQWKWLTTAGSLTYPFYLLHYGIGTTLIHHLHDRIDARLLVPAVIIAMLTLSRLVHRFVEVPLSRKLKQGLTRAFSRLDAKH
ncbi:acyltransferase [Streptomyces sp. NBC_00243]|uniref:acyltransferase family protein n=1 Tax=Streptomyces sp. NBC_00243 TaxID=2975688 RepID=UPI002DD9D5ED|nr:acyltransferase [Streptomyces sp. NBC_00243]WRZ22797.1 acyltransferase [Streptomyces sp. NBC_00243]